MLLSSMGTKYDQDMVTLLKSCFPQSSVLPGNSARLFWHLRLLVTIHGPAMQAWLAIKYLHTYMLLKG